MIEAVTRSAKEPPAKPSDIDSQHDQIAIETAIRNIDKRITTVEDTIRDRAARHRVGGFLYDVKARDQDSDALINLRMERGELEKQLDGAIEVRLTHQRAQALKAHLGLFVTIHHLPCSSQFSMITG